MLCEHIAVKEVMILISLEKPPLDELVHSGVKGMKWGKHKKQEVSINIQNAKKDVERNKIIMKKERHKMNIETAYGTFGASKKTIDKVFSAKREYKYSQQDLSKVKILERFKNTEKSNAQLSMEKKYKKQGMSNDEATVAAYQNIKTKKILLAVGATVVTAAVAYTAYKMHDEKIDKIIKTGKTLQNISNENTKGIRDAFYSSGNNLDNAKYKGLYGKELSKKGSTFKKDIKVLSDIKQASPENAKNVLSKLASTDKNFANELKEYMQVDNSRLGDAYVKKTIMAEKSLAKGIIDKNVYEVFNASLVDHSPSMQKLTDRYFNELTSKGYNAIKDVNDSKYSGYKSLNPIIAFGTSGKVDVVNIAELAAKDIKKSEGIAVAHLFGTEVVKQGAVMATAILGALSTQKVMNGKTQNTMIKKYKTSNPDTKMTNTEIIRMLERS